MKNQFSQYCQYQILICYVLQIALINLVSLDVSVSYGHMNILAFLPLPALPLCTRLWVFTQFVGFLVFLELNTKCICCVECSLYVLSYVCSRKKKAVHKTTTTDDKRLQSTLKRIGVNAIPAIEEVNIFLISNTL